MNQSIYNVPNYYKRFDPFLDISRCHIPDSTEWMLGRFITVDAFLLFYKQVSYEILLDQKKVKINNFKTTESENGFSRPTLAAAAPQSRQLKNGIASGVRQTCSNLSELAVGTARKRT